MSINRRRHQPNQFFPASRSYPLHGRTSAFPPQRYFERNTRIFIFIFSLVIVLCILRAYLRDEKQQTFWKVSAAQSPITPYQPVWLSGFASRNRTAESTEPLDGHIPLYARAIAIRNHTKQGKLSPFVIVSVDVIGFDHHFSENILIRAEQNFGLTRDRLRICATHTHSGPVVGGNLAPLMPNNQTERQEVDRYTKYLTSEILRTIHMAIKLPPETVTASFTEAIVPMGVNRRQVKEDYFQGMRGLTEDRVPIIWFSNKKGIVAGIFGVAAHATTLTKNYRYSGDYPGFAAKRLEDVAGGLWLFLAGCGGDQNVYPRGTVELMHSHGTNLAVRIHHAVRSGGKKLKVETASKEATINIPFAKRYTARELLLRGRSKNKVERRAVEGLLANGIGSDGKTLNTYAFPLATWRLGDVKIVFMGGEPTVGYCGLLKESGANWIVGYCQDVMGYIGTADIIREGGREGGERAAWYYGLPAAWSQDVEHLITTAVSDMLSQI